MISADGFFIYTSFRKDVTLWSWHIKICFLEIACSPIFKESFSRVKSKDFVVIVQELPVRKLTIPPLRTHDTYMTEHKV